MPRHVGPAATLVTAAAIRLSLSIVGLKCREATRVCSDNGGGGRHDERISIRSCFDDAAAMSSDDSAKMRARQRRAACRRSSRRRRHVVERATSGRQPCAHRPRPPRRWVRKPFRRRHAAHAARFDMLSLLTIICAGHRRRRLKRPPAAVGRSPSTTPRSFSLYRRRCSSHEDAYGQVIASRRTSARHHARASKPYNAGKAA